MALLKIAKLGHPVLRERAVEVDPADISAATFQQFIDDMAQTMRDSDGVGLAAPQVYAGQRVIVVEVKGPSPLRPDLAAVPLTVLVNPTLLDHADEQDEDWEGCLSLPDLRGRVPRWRAVRFGGLNRHGTPIEVAAEGFFARVLQHELDHLDGVMFLARMRNLSTLTYLREFQRHWQMPVG